MEASHFIGHVIGGWCIQRALGEGAFGAVFQAEHSTAPGRLAAVKILRPELSLQPQIKQRFLNEATAAGRAEHANIVQVIDSGCTSEGLYFLVMELVQGASLGEVLRRGQLSVDRVIHIGVQIAGALHAAHGRHVVHRDLKPDNIFITQHGQDPDFVKVLDFGVAKLRGEEDQKLTSTGMIIGTGTYMAPEQWMGRSDLDGRADIYALGVILFECLAGTRPFHAENQFAWMKLHMEGARPPAGELERRGVPPALAGLVLRMLASRPEDRPQSMGAVVRELQTLGSATAPTLVVPQQQTPWQPVNQVPWQVPWQQQQPAQRFPREALAKLYPFALSVAAVVIYVIMNWHEAAGWFQRLTGGGPRH